MSPQIVVASANFSSRIFSSRVIIMITALYVRDLVPMAIAGKNCRMLLFGKLIDMMALCLEISGAVISISGQGICGIVLGISGRNTRDFPLAGMDKTLAGGGRGLQGHNGGTKSIDLPCRRSHPLPRICRFQLSSVDFLYTDFR